MSVTARSKRASRGGHDQKFGLRDSPFRPAICEVTIAEMLAFAHAGGAARRKLLDEVFGELLVLPITARPVHDEWAKLRSHARTHGLAAQHDHNDLWIAATANVAGLTVITTDAAAFGPLRASGLVKAELVDPKSGLQLP